MPSAADSDALHASDLKVTRQRSAILRVLRASKHSLSVRDVIKKLASSRVNQATVYRNLEALTAVGAVRRIDLRHGHAHYESASQPDHHHLTCLRCGRVEKVEGCNLRTAGTSVLRRSRHFATVTQHSLEFFGLCKTCSRA